MAESIPKGADLQLLLSRESDLEILDDISNCKCSNCNKFEIDHYFTNCSHILCSNCKQLLENGGMKCPKCNLAILNINNPSTYRRTKIFALKSKCPNAKYGCCLITNLAVISGHIKDCKFTKKAALPVLSKGAEAMHGVLDKIDEHNIQLVNIETEVTKLRDYTVELEEYKEKLKMELKGLRSDVHEMKTDIQFAGEDNKKITIETQLQKMLNDLELRLNSKITKNENRIEAAVDQLDRLNQRINEQTQNVVEEVDKRLIDLQAAQKENKIRDWLNEKSNVNQLLDGFLFGPSKEQSYFESLCYKWTLKFDDPFLYEEMDKECFSSIFSVFGYDLKAQLILTYYSDVNVYLEMCFKDDEKDGQTVDLKCLPIVTYIFKNSNRNGKHIIRCHSCLFSTTLKYNEYYYGKYIGNIFKSISSTERSLEVLLLVEPLSFINKMPNNGTIVDTIHHYSKKLQMEKDQVFYGHRSPPFLTHADGYRVRIRMLLNGKFNSDKKGLEAVETFLSGEFDSQLEKRFRHEIIITLMHPNDSTKNITVNKHFMGTDSCTLSIASEDDIFLEGFILDDSISYKVTIVSTQKKKQSHISNSRWKLANNKRTETNGTLNNNLLEKFVDKN